MPKKKPLKKKKKKKKASPKKVSPKVDIQAAVFKRSLFFAVCMFALYQFLMIPLQIHAYELFGVMAIGGFVIVLVELLYSRITVVKRPLSLKVKMRSRQSWREHFIHHLILPGLLYVSGVLFLFFNRIRILDQFAIVTLTCSFLILFYNISMKYLRRYSVSRKTRYIFDFVNIIVFYFFTDVIVNLVFYWGLPRVITYLVPAVMGMFLVCLMILISQQLSRITIPSMIISGVIIGIIAFGVLMIPVFNIAVLSLVVTVGFYLVDVYWHHKLDGSFNWDVMSQYMLFALMAIILLLYL